MNDVTAVENILKPIRDAIAEYLERRRKGIAAIKAIQDGNPTKRLSDPVEYPSAELAIEASLRTEGIPVGPLIGYSLRDLLRMAIPRLERIGGTKEAGLVQNALDDLRGADNARQAKVLARLLSELQPAPANKAKGARKRRHQKRQPKALTPKQSRAVEVVAEHEGNLTAAAKAIGVDRTTIKQHVDAANKKLGMAASAHLKPKTRDLSHDSRGQLIHRDPKVKQHSTATGFTPRANTNSEDEDED